MITEKKFLICTCDSCGKLLFDDEENCVFGNIDAVDAAIFETGWLSTSGSQLCYNCYLNKIEKS